MSGFRDPGAAPDWFWPAMGRVALILGLPSGRRGYVFTRLAGGWAIQPDPAGRWAEHLRRAWPGFLSGRRRAAGGPGQQCQPGLAGRIPWPIWLTTYAPGSGIGRTAGVTRQYTGSGAKIGAPVLRSPVGYGITQGTRRGLLLVRSG